MPKLTSWGQPKGLTTRRQEVEYVAHQLGFRNYESYRMHRLAFLDAGGSTRDWDTLQKASQTGNQERIRSIRAQLIREYEYDQDIIEALYEDIVVGMKLEPKTLKALQRDFRELNRKARESVFGRSIDSFGPSVL